MLKVTVFIVDQDTPTVSDLENRLQALGHRILAVSRFLNHAAEQITLNRPQIIFVNAPPNWGTKILQTVEELGTFGIPIILVLTREDKNSLEASVPQLSFDLVTKPIIKEEIQATIKFALYRQQSQKEIQTREQHLRAILHSTGEGFVTFDMQGILLYMNVIAEMLTGWTQNEAYGRNISEVLRIIDHGDGNPIEIPELLERRLKTGPLSGFDITLINRENKEIPVRARVSPIRDYEGRMNGGVIAFGNISELTHAIQQMQVHSQRAEVLLDIIAKLNSKLDLDNVLQALLQETTAMMKADGAVVILLNGDGSTYQVVATHSVNDHLHRYKGRKLKMANQPEVSLIDQRQPVQIISDMNAKVLTPYHDLLNKEHISTLALAQLQSENQILGAMFILSTGKPREYSEDELSFLKGLADQASLAITNARLFENVRDSRFRLQYLSKRLVEVQEAERRSMARELHDQIGQMLTGLQFSLASGKRKVSGEAQDIFIDAQEIVSNLIKQVRELSLRLLPSILEDLGLLPTLQWHFEQYSHQTGIRVDFSQSGLEDKRLPQNIEVTAYRIVQEGLTNAARYAQVNHVKVDIHLNDTLVHLVIKDTGKGFDPEKTVISRQTFGLIGMRERTMLVGGKFTVNSSPGKGTQIEAYLPLENHIERRTHVR